MKRRYEEMFLHPDFYQHHTQKLIEWALFQGLLLKIKERSAGMVWYGIVVFNVPLDTL